MWVCSSPGRRLTFSENSRKNLGESRARRKILGVICRKFRDFQGFSHYQTASFAGAPITTRESCHVTQPRAWINVSCSRADQKGATGGRGNLKKRTAKASEGQRRPAKEAYRKLDGTERDRRTGRERDSTAPLTQPDPGCCRFQRQASSY